MTTVYEEACRRIGDITRRIQENITSGRINPIVGRTAIRGYHRTAYEMQEVYLGDAPERAAERAYLRSEFIPANLPDDVRSFDPSTDPVRGLIGIGPEGAIPKELFTMKPD
jgi:hypothetical protein